MTKGCDQRSSCLGPQLAPACLGLIRCSRGSVPSPFHLPTMHNRQLSAAGFCRLLPETRGGTLRPRPPATLPGLGSSPQWWESSVNLFGIWPPCRCLQWGRYASYRCLRVTCPQRHIVSEARDRRVKWRSVELTPSIWYLLSGGGAGRGPSPCRCPSCLRCQMSLLPAGPRLPASVSPDRFSEHPNDPI